MLRLQQQRAAAEKLVLAIEYVKENIITPLFNNWLKSVLILLYLSNKSRKNIIETYLLSW